MRKQQGRNDMTLTAKAERTKAKLLASARKLISERGFDHVSVEDITRDSGVAKGTFYHYFKCKEDVVAEISFISAQEIIRKATEYEGTVQERVFFYVTHVFKDGEWSGLRLVRQWLRDSMDPDGSRESQEAVINMHQTIKKILTAAIGERPGDLRKDAPIETLAKLFMSHITGVMTLWCIMNGAFSLSDTGGLKYTRLNIDNLLSPYIIR